MGYDMSKWSLKLNHISYADDSIIFTSTDEYFLGKIMDTLQKYEKEFQQKVNKVKSSFYLHQNIAGNVSLQVDQSTRMTKGFFPTKYLGCPITHKRKEKRTMKN